MGSRVFIPVTPGLVPLHETVVGSAVASVDITTNVDWTAYDKYFCTFKEVSHSDSTSPPSGSVLNCRFSNDAGATFKSGASDYVGSNSEIQLSEVYKGTTGRADGNFILRPDPGLVLTGSAAAGVSASGLPALYAPIGGWDYSFGALDGLQFIVPGYNITAGTFRIYGVIRP